MDIFLKYTSPISLVFESYVFHSELFKCYRMIFSFQKKKIQTLRQAILCIY